MKKFDYQIVQTNPFDYLRAADTIGGTCTCTCSVDKMYAQGYSAGAFDNAQQQ